MKNRLALSITAATTLFVVIIGSGVALYFSRNYPADASATSTTSASAVQADPVSNQPSIEQQVQSLVDGREAAYRQALDDANRKLQQANAQLEQAYAIINSLKQVSQPAAPAPTVAPQPTPAAQPAQTNQAAQSAPGYAVSAAQAATIALTMEPTGQLLWTPDLVNFQGTAAYEVHLDLGLVYVDASSGNVLYDGVAPAQPSIPNPQNQEQQENEGGEGNG